jgi:regulator of replication initiation timing
MVALLGALLSLLVTPSLAAATTAAVRENPIRKVVTLMQNLREEVEEEGRKDKELFDKFMCYCTDNVGKLEKSVEAANADIGEYEATIKELTGSNAALELEIKDVTRELEEAKKAIADATGVRTKEKNEFTAESSETANAISSLDKAIPAIEKGTAPATALAQVNLGASLLRHAPTLEDKSVLEGLLQAHATVSDMDSSVGSAQILGILQQMRDNFKDDLSASTKSEEDAQNTYNELKAAKEKQIAAQESELREKTMRVSNQKGMLAEAQENHEDTSAALEADENFLIELKENCKSKQGEFDQNAVERSNEVKAIGEAIKILNDDSALDLFKSTLPGTAEAEAPPAFLQLRVAHDPARVTAAAREIQRAARGLSARDMASVTLVQLQLQRAAQAPDQFAPVKKMITDMVSTLLQEQEDDTKQKDFCAKSIPQAGVDKTNIQQGLDDKVREMDEMKTELTSIAQKIEVLSSEIAELDEAVQKSTEQRKEENSFHTTAMAENAMAMQLLNKAKAKLDAVYAAKDEPSLLEVRRIDSTKSDPDAQINAMLGLSFLQVSEKGEDMLSQSLAALSGTEPPPPPEATSYGKKTAQGMGIMGLMSELISDLKLEGHKAQMAEAAAQKAYEEGLANSQASREATSKEVVAMQTHKAELEEKKHEAKASHRTLGAEMKSIVTKIASLHEECDFIVSNYDLRKNARAHEIEAMRNAVAILSGANFALTQQER